MRGLRSLYRLLRPPKRQRRIDACLLHNEIDLLILRIEELWNAVDHFVVVEANETFSGLPKPLFFRDHQSQFKPYADKLVYHSVHDLPEIRQQSERARFAREAAQRNAITAAIERLALSREDVVLVCDVDEIPRASRLAEIESVLTQFDHAIFMLKNYRGYINNISDAALNLATVAGPVACQVATLQRVGAHQVRKGDNRSGGIGLRRSSRYRYIEDGGWHFSSLGGPDAIWCKAASFSHIDDPHRLIALAEQTPEQQVFRTPVNRDQCRDLQRRYLTHCEAPAFSPLSYDNFAIEQDVPDFLRRERERFRHFFFFNDLT